MCESPRYLSVLMGFMNVLCNQGLGMLLVVGVGAWTDGGCFWHLCDACEISGACQKKAKDQRMSLIFLPFATQRGRFFLAGGRRTIVVCSQGGLHDGREQHEGATPFLAGLRTAGRSSCPSDSLSRPAGPTGFFELRTRVCNAFLTGTRFRATR